MRALLSLAIGSFGIGMTEFVVMGLLPNIAADLLPGAWAANVYGSPARSAAEYVPELAPQESEPLVALLSQARRARSPPGGGRGRSGGPSAQVRP